jgi:hypothetical protein
MEKFKITGKHPHSGCVGKMADEHKFPPRIYQKPPAMYAIELDKKHNGTEVCYVNLDQLVKI